MSERGQAARVRTTRHIRSGRRPTGGEVRPLHALPHRIDWRYRILALLMARSSKSRLLKALYRMKNVAAFVPAPDVGIRGKRGTSSDMCNGDAQ